MLAIREIFPMVAKDSTPLPNSMEGICRLSFNFTLQFPPLQSVYSLRQAQSSANSCRCHSFPKSTRQEIIVTSTSTMFTSQQMALSFPQGTTSIKSTMVEELQKKQSNIQLNFGNNDTDIDLRGTYRL